MIETDSSMTMEADLLNKALRDAVTYDRYRKEMSRQAENGETSGPVQSEALIEYTFLNDRRMRRWERTFQLSDALADRLQENQWDQTWLVLTESWCGDAAPILPVLNVIAETTPGIELRIADRDRNPDLMALFPTDGALAIPKLLVLNKDQNEVLHHWGPRPSEPMEMVREYKRKHGKLSPEFRETLQRWYNKDKGRAISTELLGLLALE